MTRYDTIRYEKIRYEKVREDTTRDDTTRDDTTRHDTTNMAFEENHYRNVLEEEHKSLLSGFLRWYKIQPSEPVCTNSANDGDSPNDWPLVRGHNPVQRITKWSRDQFCKKRKSEE
jgi:hypothetical protein